MVQSPNIDRFEGSTRVPLIISASGGNAAKGERTRSLMELIDFYPTLSDLRGLPEAGCMSKGRAWFLCPSTIRKSMRMLFMVLSE